MQRGQAVLALLAVSSCFLFGKSSHPFSAQPSSLALGSSLVLCNSQQLHLALVFTALRIDSEHSSPSPQRSVWRLCIAAVAHRKELKSDSQETGAWWGQKRVRDTSRGPRAKAMALGLGLKLRLSVLNAALPNFTESRWPAGSRLMTGKPLSPRWLFQCPFSTAEAYPQLLQGCGGEDWGAFLES